MAKPGPETPSLPTDVDLDAQLTAALRPLGRSLGWPDWQPRVLGRHSNHVLALPPSPWVARVPTGTARWRGQPARVARELSVAKVLAQAGAPVIGPAPDAAAGPHRLSSGHLASLWHRVEVAPDRPDPANAGAGLAHCHRVLADLPLAGPPLTDPALPREALDELGLLLADPQVQAVAQAADLALVADLAARTADRRRQAGAARQWLHGDAHLNNALQTSAGPVWADWEDAAIGCPEDDLAGLLAASQVLGDDGRWAEAAVAGWSRAMGRQPDPEALALGVMTRTLFVTGWLWALGATAGPPERRQRLDGRLAWLRRQAPG